MRVSNISNEQTEVLSRGYVAVSCETFLKNKKEEKRNKK